jgi:HK97 family phage major capsid protein
MNPAELRRQMAAKANEARAIYDKAKKENRAVTQEEETRYQALLSEAKALKAEAERLEELEGYTGPTRPESQAPAHHRRPTEDTEAAIYCRYLRTGDHGAAAELRASNDTDMNIGTAADGGNLVPVGHYQGIIARRDEMALDTRLGVLDIPGTGTTVNVPVDNEADGEFVATNEAAAFDRDAAAVDKKQMTLVMYTKKLEISYQLLQDEDSRLMTFIEDWIGRGMARTQNSLLVTEALANGTAGMTFDNATAILPAEIPELVYLLQEEYEDGAAWLMRRSTEGAIRSLVDDNAFMFAPTPGGTDRPRRELWGFPAHATQYMPAIAASAKSLLFGNFRYMGRRLAPDITFLRDPYTLAGNGQIRLLYHFRTVYKVLQAEAFQYGTHPTG